MNHINKEVILIDPDKKCFNRFNMFLDEIMSYYNKLIKGKNTLVIGQDAFLEVFKKYCKYNCNCTYVNNLMKQQEKLDKYDIIIDTKNDKSLYEKIYMNINNKKIYSFMDLYAKVLFQKTIDFLNANNILFMFFYAPRYLKKIKRPIKNWKETRCDKDLLNKLYKDNIECLNYALSEEADLAFSNIDNGNHNILQDVCGKYVNIINGKRLTVGLPKNPQNMIYFYGPCTVRGGFVSDAYTIPSFVQKFVNKRFYNKYGVVNCGTNGGRRHIDYFEYILNTTFKSGDVVILIDFYNNILEEVMKKKGVITYELSSLFNKSGSEFWFIDNAWHPTHRGNEEISKFIVKKITPLLKNKIDYNLSFGAAKSPKIKYTTKNSSGMEFWTNNNSFNKYIRNIKLQIPKSWINNGRIGSIVMNCNPFTLGHRYIIDEALKVVDYLYIFVVEENGSFFSFSDRMNMVNLGVNDLKNVKIFPSGQWIISLITFPEYFNKEIENNIVIDPSLDVNLFKTIASELKISARFVGEEPNDYITRQYNECMKSEFEKSDIKLYEIPRKCINEDIISASSVRKLYKNNDYASIRKFVPESVYDYLTKLKKER